MLGDLLEICSDVRLGSVSEEGDSSADNPLGDDANFGRKGIDRRCVAASTGADLPVGVSGGEAVVVGLSGCVVDASRSASAMVRGGAYASSLGIF